jgi:hypothetical protein
MVNKEEKRSRGRPAGDPDDLRTERIAIRVHPDLIFELNVLARLDGVTRSVLVERLLIRLVNDHYHRTVVDQIGRYVVGPPEDDLFRVPARGIEFLRQEQKKATPKRRPNPRSFKK